MSETYNADEVFAMAEEIEREGTAFYRAAAERLKNDGPIRSLLLELADWEAEHEEIFRILREKLRDAPESQIDWRFNEETELYLRARAEAKVFAPEKDADQMAAECRDLGDVLLLAIDKEKDSVVFYASLSESVPEGLGKAKIGPIIAEEIRHIGLLTRRLVAYHREA
jgi:rubrerythrin